MLMAHHPTDICNSQATPVARECDMSGALQRRPYARAGSGWRRDSAHARANLSSRRGVASICRPARSPLGVEYIFGIPGEENIKYELLKRRPEISIAKLKAPGIWSHPAYQQQREADLYAGLLKVGIPEN